MAPDDVGLDRSVQAVSQREIRSQPAVEPKSIAVEVTSVSEKPDFITRFREHHKEKRLPLERVRSLRQERHIHSDLKWNSLLDIHLTRDQTKSKRSKRSESVPAKPPRYPVDQNRPKMPIPAKRTSIPSHDSDSDDNIYETISGIILVQFSFHAKTTSCLNSHKISSKIHFSTLPYNPIPFYHNQITI